MPMYNLLEYSWNCSDTTGSLWFYSKDKASNFNANIANTNSFKSFEDKAKVLVNTVDQPEPDNNNKILKYSTILVPLTYLSNSWRSLEISLINGKVQLKLKVLAAAGADNVNANDDNIIFTIKDTKSYVSVATLSAKDNQKLSKLLSKEFNLKDQCIGVNIKLKVKIKMQQMSIDIFLHETL